MRPTGPSPNTKPVAKREWGIRDFAEMFGVTPRTVRFYEDKGLLQPERDGQTRRFGPRQHARFERILRGKRLGFSLDDIRAVFDVMEGRISDQKELHRRRNNFQGVIDGLAERRRDLQLLEADMTEIVSVIDEHLSQNPDVETTDVAQLAARYQAAFAQHLDT
jgi:DNA-binding transcriptional MerR regulator